LGAFAVAASESATPDGEVVRRMLAASPHRGTELTAHECGRVTLGVSNDAARRDTTLAVQPDAAAVFCGVLDNAQALNAELRRAGVDIADETPAATVLSAIRTWGASSVERLRGVFGGAFVAGDEIVVFRDHVGFGTAFWGEPSGGFVAATEAKQVSAALGKTREPDLEAVEDIFFGRLAEQRTALLGVERLPRASLARSGRGIVSVERYWHPEALVESAQLSLDDACEGFLVHFDQAVARSLTGRDVLLLSGGIDSPAIAALAAPRYGARFGRGLAALTAVYPDQPSVDEKRYVDAIVAQLEMPLHTYVPEARPLDDVERWVTLTDGPVDTLSIPESAECYRLSRDLGAVSVLTGELAEYVFTISAHLAGHLALHRRWRPLAAWARALRASGRPWSAVARRAAPSLAPAFVAGRYTRLLRRDRRFLPGWIDPAQVGGLGRRRDLERRARDRWTEAQLDALRGASITVEADALCAASLGVHVRRPFADVDLWEFALSLPAETKFPDLVPKSLIRHALRGRLPDLILDRKDKTAFDAHTLAAADYDALRKWIVGGEYRVSGVDYRRLEERLDRRDFGVMELMWANDLARVHAFVRQS
jgi:asparagine synthase (glutamine-hydrolysing)